MSRRALLLVNRHARRGQQALGDVVRLLAQQELELHEVSSSNPYLLSEIIRGYRDRVDLVIVGGGDGTLNMAAAGLVDTQLPLAILPLGTANDLARTLGLPSRLAAACEVIRRGKLRRIDLGWVNGRYFFNVASIGLTTRISERLRHEDKRRWGVWAYAAVALQVFRQARSFSAQVVLDGRILRLKSIQIAVGNGRFYGGGMSIARDAAIDDARLDLYSLAHPDWRHMIRLLPSLRRGQYEWSPKILSASCREIKIYTDPVQPINTDGEITTSTPATFRVLPQAISVFVP